MTPPSGRGRKTVEIAEQVSDLLRSLGIESAVIGAMALAVHGYVRSTRDFDLATYTNPFTVLRQAQQALSAAGWRAELRTPDAEDPLGGVVEIRGPTFKPIQVVNFFNPFAPARASIAEEAILTAAAGKLPGSSLKVVNVPHLIALKLYAGGLKSKSDIAELLEHHRDLDLESLRKLCIRHGLGDRLEGLLDELGS